jgi:hypothetical protein
MDRNAPFLVMIFDIIRFCKIHPWATADCVLYLHIGSE